FESLVGAIFLDQGLDAARDFVLSKLSSHLDRVRAEGIGRNYKALLQGLPINQSHLMPLI
ncbi:MAG: ribonuclease III, partial [Dehalococcoidia bacterium]|nr:ribonuclease III [Dehalococcoidia bacterium]